MAGTLRAEVNLAAANGLYLILLLLGGMIVPISQAPVAVWPTSPSCCPRRRSRPRCTRRSDNGAAVPGESWIVLARVGGGGAGRRGAHVPLGMRARSSAVNDDRVSCRPATILAIVPSRPTKTAYGSPSK